MSRPAPQSAEDRDPISQRVDAPLHTAPSAPPISATASTGAGAAAERQTQPRPRLRQSIAQSCHTDALHCIFAFLSLADLLPVMQSCRSWNTAGSKEPPRGLKLSINPSCIAVLIDSPLRRHVAQLTLDCACMQLDQLRPLRALPRLTALDTPLDGSALRAPNSPDPSAGDTQEQHAQTLRAYVTHSRPTCAT